jgi:hypothetical protein
VGFARIQTSAGSWTLFAGDELRDKKSGLRFKCLVTGAYSDGARVPIGGIDTGPKTNLAPGAVLTWTSPRPGVGPTAVVLRQPNGLGLSNGRSEEQDGELRERIRLARANPPASGNDADYQAAIESALELPIQKGFGYPALLGPGSKGFVFTLRPERPGASRIPNAAQIATALAHVVGRMPADDSIFACTLVEAPVPMALRIAWGAGAHGWHDAKPWPASGSSPVRVAANPAPTTTEVWLDVGSQASPRPGHTLAFYDARAHAFRRKRVLSVQPGAGALGIVCDMAHQASDDYVPLAGQLCSPWSDSLAGVIAPVLEHFDRLGPGEQVTTPFDPGRRQRRQPPSPRDWPSVLTARVVSGLLDQRFVDDVAVLAPALPYATPVGIPGVLSRLLVLSDLAAYAA